MHIGYNDPTAKPLARRSRSIWPTICAAEIGDASEDNQHWSLKRDACPHLGLAYLCEPEAPGRGNRASQDLFLLRPLVLSAVDEPLLRRLPHPVLACSKLTFRAADLLLVHVALLASCEEIVCSTQATVMFRRKCQCHTRHTHTHTTR